MNTPSKKLHVKGNIQKYKHFKMKKTKKNEASQYLQLIINCKGEAEKQSLLSDLMKDERVDNIQLGEGGTLVHYGSFTGYLSDSSTIPIGSNNNFFGEKHV